MLLVSFVFQASAEGGMADALKKLEELKMQKLGIKTTPPAKTTSGESSSSAAENNKLKAIKKMEADKSAIPSDDKLAAEPMPADAYRGSDKAQILQLAESKWNAKHPNKKILAKGIAMKKWDRKTVWRRESLNPNKKYKVDFSEIQVWVITKTDEKVATQYIVEVSKDHTKNDKYKVYVPEDLNSSGIFKTHMLVKNVK